MRLRLLYELKYILVFACWVLVETVTTLEVLVTCRIKSELVDLLDNKPTPLVHLFKEVFVIRHRRA